MRARPRANARDGAEAPPSAPGRSCRPRPLRRGNVSDVRPPSGSRIHRRLTRSSRNRAARFLRRRRSAGSRERPAPLRPHRRRTHDQAWTELGRGAALPPNASAARNRGCRRGLACEERASAKALPPFYPSLFRPRSARRGLAHHGAPCSADHADRRPRRRTRSCSSGFRANRDRGRRQLGWRREAALPRARLRAVCLSRRARHPSQANPRASAVRRRARRRVLPRAAQHLSRTRRETAPPRRRGDVLVARAGRIRRRPTSSPWLSCKRSAPFVRVIRCGRRSI